MWLRGTYFGVCSDPKTSCVRLKTLMMKRFFFIAVLIASLAGCAKDESFDTSISPAINLIIDSAATGNCTCEPYIEKYKWQGKYVYLMLTAGPACLSAPVYFNEDGTRIIMASTYSYNDF